MAEQNEHRPQTEQGRTHLGEAEKDRRARRILREAGIETGEDDRRPSEILRSFCKSAEAAAELGI